MKNHRHSTIPATAGLILLLSGATAPALAQASASSPGIMPQHQTGMKDMQGMDGMMGAPHHVLAMAYRDNLVTFTQALQGQVRQSKSVNLDLARPAVAEMRRSFDQMQQHHHAQMTTMGDKQMGEKPMPEKSMAEKPMGGKMMGGMMTGGKMMGSKMTGDQAKPSMSETMQGMEKHIAMLNEHLTALESAVNAGTLDPMAVSTHTTEILKLCATVSAKPAETKPHHDDVTKEHRPAR